MLDLKDKKRERTRKFQVSYMGTRKIVILFPEIRKRRGNFIYKNFLLKLLYLDFIFTYSKWGNLRTTEIN